MPCPGTVAAQWGWPWWWGVGEYPKSVSMREADPICCGGSTRAKVFPQLPPHEAVRKAVHRVMSWGLGLALPLTSLGGMTLSIA